MAYDLDNKPRVGMALIGLSAILVGSQIPKLVEFIIRQPALSSGVTSFNTLFEHVIDLFYIEAGLDHRLATYVAALLIALGLLLLPTTLLLWIAPTNQKSARTAPVLLLLLALVGIAVYYTGSHVYIERETGEPRRYYIRTMDGYRFSSRPDFDPELGIRYKPITPAVARELYVWKRTGKVDTPPVVVAGQYFDQETGEPIVWYYDHPDGSIDLFPLPGFHPLYGDTLRPITKEKVVALVAHEKADQEARDKAQREADIQSQNDRQRREEQTAVEQRQKNALAEAERLLKETQEAVAKQKVTIQQGAQDRGCPSIAA